MVTQPTSILIFDGGTMPLRKVAWILVGSRVDLTREPTNRSSGEFGSQLPFRSRVLPRRSRKFNMMISRRTILSLSLSFKRLPEEERTFRQQRLTHRINHEARYLCLRPCHRRCLRSGQEHRPFDRLEQLRGRHRCHPSPWILGSFGTRRRW